MFLIDGILAYLFLRSRGKKLKKNRKKGARLIADVSWAKDAHKGSRALERGLKDVKMKGHRSR